MTFPYTEEQFRKKVASAAAFYWKTRRQQAASQKKRGVKDAGSRGQVTGGRHLDGFARLIQEICIKAGFTKAEVSFDRAVPVPGYYRPQKNWDVVVMRDGRLVAAIELKSQSGSFGNNFNNRTEEVLGVSRDFWVAYRERVFGVTEAPWLGYLFSLRIRRLLNVPLRWRTARCRRFQCFKERVTFGDTRFSANDLCWNATTRRPRFSCPIARPRPYATGASRWAR